MTAAGRVNSSRTRAKALGNNNIVCCANTNYGHYALPWKQLYSDHTHHSALYHKSTAPKDPEVPNLPLNKQREFHSHSCIPATAGRWGHKHSQNHHQNVCCVYVGGAWNCKGSVVGKLVPTKTTTYTPTLKTFKTVVLIHEYRIFTATTILLQFTSSFRSLGRARHACCLNTSRIKHHSKTQRKVIFTSYSVY